MLYNKNKIFSITLFSALTALCYVATFVMIPLPTGGKIHLGNLVCILASLILGGVPGGLVGSIGMGLNDLHFYLDTPSTIIRTFVLKFIMGFVCGSLFNLLRKKNIKSQKCSLVLFILAFIFLATGIYSLYVYIVGGVKIGETLISFNMLVPIGLFVFMFIFILFGIIFLRKEEMFNYLLLAVSIATLVNILGEFVFRSVLSIYIDRMGWAASLTLSLSKIPASILTGVLTSILTIVIYPPLSIALDAKIENI